MTGTERTAALAQLHVFPVAEILETLEEPERAHGSALG